MVTKKSSKATKKTGRASGKTSETRNKARRTGKESREAVIRMYRQGLGNCFLITFPRKPKPFHMLLDCGALKSKHYGEQEMKGVVNDILKTTSAGATTRGRAAKSGLLDVVAATHEHWDHISGFVQAQELFDKMKVGHVWVAWTKEPNNEVAERLKKQFKKKKAVEKALALIPDEEKGDQRMDVYRKAISELFGFFGGFGAAAAAPGQTTEDAWDYILKMGRKVYCDPQKRPLEIEGVEELTGPYQHLDAKAKPWLRKSGKAA